MATCVQPVTFYAYATSAGGTLTPVQALMPVAGDPSSCTAVVLSGTDLTDVLSVAATRITDQATAEAVAGSVVLLLAVMFGIKMVVRALNVGDEFSDEKH